MCHRYLRMQLGAFLALTFVTLAGCASEETTRNEALAKAAQQTEPLADSLTMLRYIGDEREAVGFEFYTNNETWMRAVDIVVDTKDPHGDGWFWLAVEFQRASQDKPYFAWVPFHRSELGSRSVQSETGTITVMGGNVDALHFCRAFMRPGDTDYVSFTRAWMYFPFSFDDDAVENWHETMVVPGAEVSVLCNVPPEQPWNGAPLALHRTD